MAKIISFKKYPDLLCNHNGAQFVNIGYSVGITSNGVPYEAELWHDDKCLCIGVVVPFIKEFGEMNTEPVPKNALPKVVNFGRAKEAKEKESTDNIEGPDFSMLCVGMIDDGVEVELDTVKNYVEFLVEEKIVDFTSEIYHGAVKYRVNVAGHSVAEIMIVLKDGVDLIAVTNLEYKDFPNTKNAYDYRKELKLVNTNVNRVDDSDMNHNKPLDLKKLRLFAEKWLGFTKRQDFNIYDFNEFQEFSEEAWAVGLQMDCANLFAKKYPYIAVTDRDDFISNIIYVQDIQALGNCIFSCWRHFHGWIRDINDSECYIVAFERLLQLIEEEDPQSDEDTEKLFPKIIGFHSPEEEYGYFSNWYLSDFEYAGIKYTSVEQFMMYHKVLMAANTELAERIMSTDDPAQIQELAGTKHFYDYYKIKDAWEKYSYTIVKRGIRAKFIQNKWLMANLLRTEKAVLVECSKSDKQWGIGINIANARWMDVKNWQGNNKLGRILMELRSEFVAMLLQMKDFAYNDAYRAEPIYEWTLTPSELLTYPEYHNTVSAYVSTLSKKERKLFLDSQISLVEWDKYLQRDMDCGIKSAGFYEMKQDIYDIADRIAF